MYLPSPAVPEKADFVIITAKKEELQAVRHILRLGETPITDQRNWWYGTVQSESNGSHFVVCSCCEGVGAIGNIDAALLAAETLERWKPNFLLVVGIAGGVKGRIRLGDVVVHNALVYYELKKTVNGEDRDRSSTHQPPSRALLVLADLIMSTERDWQKDIDIKRPDGTQSRPKLLIGQILSGEKLLAPTSPILGDLLRDHDKALAVEMESGGVARSLWLKSSTIKTEFLIIRGISDYCNESDKDQQETRNSWTAYSASAAADLALAIISTTVKQGNDGSTLQGYRDRFKKKLSDFPVAPTEFPLICTMKDQEPIKIEALVGKTLKLRRLLLRGRAGGGKSMGLVKLAGALLDSKFIPVFVSLKNWPPTNDYAFMHAEDDKKAFDALLRAAIGDLNVAMLAGFTEKMPRFVIVDGINEVRRETATRILDVLDEFVRIETSRLSCVLVSDRADPQRNLSSSWTVGELQLVEDPEVEKMVDSNFGAGTYASTSEADKTLLRIPYFLDYALRSKSVSLGTKANAIRAFFKDHLSLEDKELDEIAEVAFNMYRENGSRSFKEEDFKKKIGQTTWDLLLKDGTIEQPIDGLTHFDHQLKHDYLAARRLAGLHDQWTPESFDVVSFQSNSLDSIAMVLEQLDSGLGDKFLAQVYDWNWLATVTSISNVASADTRHCSVELETAILALIVEKLFDPVLNTSKRAKRVLASFPNKVVSEMRSVASITDLIGVVEKISSTSNWFTTWKSLFALSGAGKLREDQIEDIVSENSLIGWTTANVIKRFELRDEEEGRQIRAYYNSLEKAPNKSIVRWRIVHALGALAAQSSETLLLHALDHDGYSWTRYGAARSLVEIAARTKQDGLRNHIVGELKNRVEQLATQPAILEEIGHTAFYRGFPTGWKDLMLPLMKLALKVQTRADYSQRWDAIVKDFEAFC